MIVVLSDNIWRATIISFETGHAGVAKAQQSAANTSGPRTRFRPSPVYSILLHRRGNAAGMGGKGSDLLGSVLNSVTSATPVNRSSMPASNFRIGG